MREKGWIHIGPSFTCGAKKRTESEARWVRQSIKAPVNIHSRDLSYASCFRLFQGIQLMRLATTTRAQAAYILLRRNDSAMLAYLQQETTSECCMLLVCIFFVCEIDYPQYLCRQSLLNMFPTSKERSVMSISSIRLAQALANWVILFLVYPEKKAHTVSQ